MSSNRHQRVKEVAEGVLGHPLPSEDIFEVFRDGKLFGSLADSLQKKYNHNLQGNEAVQDEISQFSQICKIMGVDEAILINVKDLQDRKSFEKVVDCILFLSTRITSPPPKINHTSSHLNTSHLANAKIEELLKKLESAEKSRAELQESLQQEQQKKVQEVAVPQQPHNDAASLAQLESALKEKEAFHAELLRERDERKKLEQLITEQRTKILSLETIATANSNSTGESQNPAVAKKLREDLLILEEAQNVVSKYQKQKELVQKKAAEISQKKAEVNQHKQNFAKLKNDLESTLSQHQKVVNQLDDQKKDLAKKKADFRQQIREEERLRNDAQTLIRDIIRSRNKDSNLKEGGKLNHEAYETIPWDQLKIGRQIGTGAFAEVFEAFRAGERVAVKRFFAQSEDARKEMETEVAVMTSLHSGYVVSLYGACFTPPNMCIVMEFLPRGSLFYLLSDSSVELPWEIRWKIARDTALGINYLHSKNPPLLHRDMKSGNLLIGADWRVKICDFGQSEEGARPPTLDEGVGGTARWTAPEVIAGNTYTEAADVYSYGIILWELATRKIPFDDVPSYDLNKLVMNGGRPPEPSDCPTEYRDLMRGCWAAKAADRPTFPQVVKTLESLGKMKLGHIDINDPISKLEALQKAFEEQKLQRDALERKWEQTERKSEKEKDLRADYERQKEMLDREYERERRRTLDYERNLETLERKASLDREVHAEKEIKIKKELKKVEQKIKRIQDELMEEKEEAMKRYEQERMKSENVKRTLEDSQSLLDTERSRRIEVEKQRDEAERKARLAGVSFRRTGSSFYG